MIEVCLSFDKINFYKDNISLGFVLLDIYDLFKQKNKIKLK